MSKKHYTSFPKSQTELNHLIFDTFSDSDFDRYNIRIDQIAQLNNRLIFISTNKNKPFSIELSLSHNPFENEKSLEYFTSDSKYDWMYNVFDVHVSLPIIISSNELKHGYYENGIEFIIDVTADIKPTSIFDEVFRKIDKICQTKNLKFIRDVNN